MPRSYLCSRCSARYAPRPVRPASSKRREVSHSRSLFLAIAFAISRLPLIGFSAIFPTPRIEAAENQPSIGDEKARSSSSSGRICTPPDRAAGAPGPPLEDDPMGCGADMTLTTDIHIRYIHPVDREAGSSAQSVRSAVPAIAPRALTSLRRSAFAFPAM